MTDLLGKLFGSPARVKMLRLFLFNKGEVLETKDTAKRIKVMSGTARREISTLSYIGFIRKKTCYKEVLQRRGNKTTARKKKIIGWTLDEKFPYLNELQIFLLKATPLSNDEIARRLSRVGKLQLVIIAGAFIQNWDSRVDILIVGNKIKQPRLRTTLRDMEAELGKELSVATLSTGDFKYRMSVYDKLIRDILDYPHETIIDRIGIS